MGIEFFWRIAKQKYRMELTEHFVRMKEIDNFRLVKDILNSITPEQTKRAALIGWQHLYNAEPIPSIAGFMIPPHDLQKDYLEKLPLSEHEPQDSHLINMAISDRNKVYVNYVFTIPVPKLKKLKGHEPDSDDSGWSPHKVSSLDELD